MVEKSVFKTNSQVTMMQMDKTLDITVLRDGSRLRGQLIRSGFPMSFASSFILPNHISVLMWSLWWDVHMVSCEDVCFRWGQQEEKERL